jgi:hypothetical protein
MLLRPHSHDRRCRILVKTVALYALGKRTRGHAIVSRSLRSRAVPPQFFSELFIHLSLFLGYPSMLDGLEHVSSVSHPHRRATLKSAGGDAHKDGAFSSVSTAIKRQNCSATLTLFRQDWAIGSHRMRTASS